MAEIDSLRKRKKKSNYQPSAIPEHDFNLESQFDISVPTYPYKSSAEYAAAVNQWLWQCYNWQCMALTLPYLVTQSACRTPTNADGTTDFNRNFPNAFFPNQNLYLSQPRRQNASAQGSDSVASLQTAGADYLIPSLCKRFVAEVIDFCILLVLKVLITYVAVDFFDLVNLEKYDLDLIKNDVLDYHKAMEVTSEIIALEVIHRFVVCIFEAICIHKGVYGNGGATPGKMLMRLRVVSCQSVVPINSNMVRIIPAGDLGIGWALLRAFIKNFSLAFIFPICFTMYFFQHNRTAYDMICNSIVVEDLPNRQQRN